VGRRGRREGRVGRVVRGRGGGAVIGLDDVVDVEEGGVVGDSGELLDDVWRADLSEKRRERAKASAQDPDPSRNE
jgi:hypothetical protein